MKEAAINIIIADDHKLFVQGIEQVLKEALPQFNIYAKVCNGKQLMQVLNSKVPDLILLDIHMPLMDGIATATAIKKQLPKVKILVVSMLQTKNIKKKLQEIGVEGYLSKDIEREELLSAIDDVLNNKKIFEKDPVLNVQPSDLVPTQLLKYNLSPREAEILALIGKGYTTRKIVSSLGIKEYTVETHRKNIARKTGISGIAEMTAFANKILD